MILKDRPESEHLPLPPDNLSLQGRLSRLFSGNENRWRIPAVLKLGSSPSDLIKPELVRLTRIFGPACLAVRLVFIGSENIDLLERELAAWSEEHIAATGDNIHARRFLDKESDYLPCIKLYSPDGFMKISLSGFDTKEGLDPLCRILSEKTTLECNKE